MSNKDKSSHSLVPKQDDQQLSDKSFNSASISGNEALEGENGMFLNAGLGVFNDDNMSVFGVGDHIILSICYLNFV